jgi:hypothetical protein
MSNEETKKSGIKPATVATAKTGSQTTAAKPAQAASATPPAPVIPSLKVDFKIAHETLQGKKEAPVELVLKTTGGKEVGIAASMTQALTECIKGQKLDKPFVISRKALLNAFCIQQKLTPAPSKRDNKNENKTVTTYGVVPKFDDGFEVDGDNYRLVAFLKHPIVIAGDAVAVKYGIYFVVMSAASYKAFSEGKMLDDAELTIVGQ